MKENNAIRISDKIEKTYIDFSTFELLKESSGFSRLYTIHAENTNELSKRLGFHVGGFCDDRGSGGPHLAAQIAGYDYLPSDLILCAMDDKYNFLPLEAKQLDALFNYLTKGETSSSSPVGQDAQRFFDHLGISPVLDDLGVKPEARFFEEFPSVICLIYRLEDDSRESLEAFSYRLYRYADRIIAETREIDDDEGYRLSKDGTYYLWRDYPDEGLYYLFIQAKASEDDPCILGKAIEAFKESLEDEDIDEEKAAKIREILYGKAEQSPKVETTEDALEEVEERFFGDEDEDDDDEGIDLPYLRFEVEAYWPDSADDYRYKSVNAKVNIYDDDPTDEEIVYFEDAIRVVKYDIESDIVVIEASMGEKKQYVITEDEPLEISFDYTPGEPSSRRVGKAKISLSMIADEEETMPGALEFRLLYLANGEIVREKKEYIKELTSNIANGTNAEPGDNQIYGIAYLDPNRRCAICYSFRNGEKNGVPTYYPVSFDEGFKRVESILDDDGRRIEQILEINYIPKDEA